jgi:hypothetical protein
MHLVLLADLFIHTGIKGVYEEPACKFFGDKLRKKMEMENMNCMIMGCHEWYL